MRFGVRFEQSPRSNCIATASFFSFLFFAIQCTLYTVVADVFRIFLSPMTLLVLLLTQVTDTKYSPRPA